MNDHDLARLVAALRPIRGRDGATLIPLHDHEPPLFMRQFGYRGPGIGFRLHDRRVALVADGCKDACALLGQWRGLLFSDGAGI